VPDCGWRLGTNGLCTSAAKRFGLRGAVRVFRLGFARLWASWWGRRQHRPGAAWWAALRRLPNTRSAVDMTRVWIHRGAEMNAASPFAIPQGLGELERSIKDDFNGDGTRALIDRLAQAASEAAALRDAAGPLPADSSPCRIEGFEAAQRIVRAVWQRLHGSVLTA
jgi:hypothetical protein